MGGACSTYGGQERCIQGFGASDLMERDELEDPGVGGRIILKRILKKVGTMGTGSFPGVKRPRRGANPHPI